MALKRPSFDNPDTGQTYEAIRPLWTIDLKDDESVRRWAEESYRLLYDEAEPRISAYRSNKERYKGNYSLVEPTIGGRDLVDLKGKQSNSKIVVNHFQDLVEQKISQILRFKPSTQVVPPSSELTDKLDAVMADELLTTLKYDNEMDSLYSQVLRMAILGGESYLFVDWDRYKGDEHPDWKEAEKKQKKIPLLDANNEQQKDVKGNLLFIDQPQYVGDVCYRVRSIENVLCAPAANPADVSWVIEHDYVHVEKLKKEYPALADKIKADTGVEAYNASTGLNQKLENHCLVFWVSHRSDRYMPKGCYFKCTSNLILEAPKDNPITRIVSSEWGNLPCRRFTDIDLADELHAYPSASNINQSQNIYDKFMTLAVKNTFLATHVKWFAIRDSVDKIALTNDSTICWVKPGYAFPEARTFTAFNADFPNMWGTVLQNMEKIFGVFSLSRGAPPPGTRSANQLNIYDEQQQQRSSGITRKLNKFIVDIDRLTLSVIADHYKDHDQRLIKLLGANDQWMIKHFKVDSLRKSYDIRVENSPNLPTSKTERLQFFLQLKQADPNILDTEQLADLLDFGNHDTFITPARVAKLAAESENLMLNRGDDVPDPEPYEDQITHWQTHMKEVQNPDYKRYPKKVRAAYEDHIRAHEMLMDDMASQSPAMAQAVTAIPQFPVFYVRPPAIQPPPEQQQAGAPGMPLEEMGIPQPQIQPEQIVEPTPEQMPV